MNLELAEKSVMVTGSSKGIGLAVAESFLNEGVSEMHLVARSADVLAQAQAQLQSRYEARITVHSLDLSHLVAICLTLTRQPGARPGI